MVRFGGGSARRTGQNDGPAPSKNADETTEKCPIIHFRAPRIEPAALMKYSFLMLFLNQMPPSQKIPWKVGLSKNQRRWGFDTKSAFLSHAESKNGTETVCHMEND